MTSPRTTWSGCCAVATPKLAVEHVVYSAHLDHLGIGEPVDGDAIYNGALDNASGVACLLEIARAFAALPARPARSILFVVVTGEERGLLGSEYFARHPTVPAGSMVADVNIDFVLALRACSPGGRARGWLETRGGPGPLPRTGTVAARSAPKKPVGETRHRDQFGLGARGPGRLLSLIANRNVSGRGQSNPFARR